MSVLLYANDSGLSYVALQQLVGEVRRYDVIKYRGYGLDGKLVQGVAKGAHARILQVRELIAGLFLHSNVFVMTARIRPYGWDSFHLKVD